MFIINLKNKVTWIIFYCSLFLETIKIWARRMQSDTFVDHFIHTLIFPHKKKLQKLLLLFPLVQTISWFLKSKKHRSEISHILCSCLPNWTILRYKKQEIAFVYTMKKWEYTTFRNVISFRRYLQPLNLMVNFHLIPWLE